MNSFNLERGRCLSTSFFQDFFMRAILVFMSFALSSTSSAEIKPLYETIIDEKIVILKNLPSQVLPFSDSTIAFITRNDCFYLSNYKTGGLWEYRLSNFIDTRELAHKFFNLDTSSNSYKLVRANWEKRNLREIQTVGITNYDEKRFLMAVDVSFPKLESVKGKDSFYTDDKQTFYLIFTKERLQIERFGILRLNWSSSERLFETPAFGFASFCDTVYIANVASPEYTGEILAAFRKEDLSRINESIGIHHKNYQNNTGLPLVSTFYINNSGRSAFVCNRTQVFDLGKREELFDLSLQETGIHQITFVAPVTKDNSRFFFAYTGAFDQNTKSFSRYRAYYDVKRSKITEVQQTLPTVYAQYKDKIISIEKRKESYAFVVYQIH